MALSRLFFICAALVSTQLHAAEWKECERAKLRQLKLEQRSHSGGKTGHKARSGKTSNSRHNAAAIDEWLWKNCRSYSNELRRLEQSRM